MNVSAMTLTALEFNRIRQELAGFAACQLGKELALHKQPLALPDAIRRGQQETTEARSLVGGGRAIPFGGIQDVRMHVERAVAGGVLRPDQLVAVADTIYGCRQLNRYLMEHKAATPLLARYAEAFGQFDAAEDEIRRCIDRGTVSSRASRSLKEIRGEIAVLESRIQERLNAILKQARQHLQEALVTTRNGRYVVPVKASARQAVPGTVHGASASGSTVFVEPEAVRELCEELAYWRAAAEAEVEQVLAILSGRVAEQGDGLQATLGAVAQLDLLVAQAKLSQAWEAQPVAWNEAGLIDLKEARHPLLGRTAVGNRIQMSADSRMLIVTGPNTGGKTLLLKTLGLLVIMARCGLHIPVAAGSTLCFFDDVLADIGDSQSLEQSLSTFSGHIANVAPMLAQAGPRTLILLDELGSGTDPHEGTGLGIALLEAFQQKGAYVLVTTHLREIKEFGRRTPGCTIAGMGFDGETLRPTFRLIYGTLGESHGIEIAARAGLPAGVVARARTLVYGSGAGTSVAPIPSLDPVAIAAPGDEPAPAAAARPQPIVFQVLSPRRCRVWDGTTEREEPVGEAVRREFPTGLVPGDRVRLSQGQVAEVARRQNQLVSRDADTQAETVIAANVTRLLIVASARQPDFHPTVLARHLFYAERQGVTPIVCLTKCDLVSPQVAAGWLQPLRAKGYHAVAVSAARRQGLDELKALLAGQFTAAVAVPGAGASTLLAALAGGSVTGIPHRLGDETWLLELPGLRVLGVWKPDLAGGLPEFGPYAGLCARPGCLHRDEPGCAVRQAVEQGGMDRHRYERYVHLLRHLRMG